MSKVVSLRAAKKRPIILGEGERERERGERWRIWFEPPLFPANDDVSNSIAEIGGSRNQAIDQEATPFWLRLTSWLCKNLANLKTSTS